jgi:hypothetical protein
VTYDPRYQKRWQLDRHRGIDRLVDSQPARTHVLELLADGASVRAIAECAGVAPSVVSRLHLARQGKLQRAVAARIIRVTMADVHARALATGFVPKVGAVRRVQALLVMGWRHEDITAAMLTANPAVGTRSQMVQHQTGQWIARTTADAVRAAYDQLAMRPGPSAKTRRLAAKYGYAPPLAWDDDTIDDPAAKPLHQLKDEHGTGVDQAAIERALAGQRVRLTRTERWTVVRRLHAQGLSDGEIARHAHLVDRTVLRDRQALGLPQNFYAPDGKTAS